MSLGITFVAAMMAYIFLIVAAVYFCVFADPDESPTALLLTETLPDKVWSLLQRYLPKSGLAFVQFVADQALAVVYLVVVLGCCSITIWYIFPWLDSQDYVARYHKYIALSFMAAALSSWRKICTCSPGLITSGTRSTSQTDDDDAAAAAAAAVVVVVKRYHHFPYDELLFESGQTCQTTGIIRPARSKFDRYKYHANVARFDHYCGWTCNTIGEENYRYFLLFLLVHLAMCMYGSYTIFQLFYGHLLQRHLLDAVFVDRVTGEEIPASKWILFQYLFNRYTLQAGQCLLMGVMSIALGLFFGYHCYLTSINMTTNEAYKWEQVNKWYKRELKRYNDALARGDIGVVDHATATAATDNASSYSNGNTNTNSNSNTQHNDNDSATKNSSTTTGPTVTDEDVTCTPPMPGMGQQRTTADIPVRVLDATPLSPEDVIRHPGPKPINIYNRGFVENWKEVLFPISLRKARTARSTKPKLT